MLRQTRNCLGIIYLAPLKTCDMTITNLSSLLGGRECRESGSHSGFSVICKTQAAGSISCTIDDDHHKHVMEILNTRGYQVAYDLKVRTERRKLELSIPYGKEGWKESRQSHGARIMGRIDTPRKVPSLTYDGKKVTEEERIDLIRMDGSDGTEELITVARCGAAEGSKNNSDPNDQGVCAVEISVTVC